MIVDAGTVGLVWKPAPPKQPTQQEESNAQDEKERS